jgi:hypothetical protein
MTHSSLREDLLVGLIGERIPRAVVVAVEAGVTVDRLG